jgi:DNA-binding MarR family transcriptional regulator
MTMRNNGIALLPPHGDTIQDAEQQLNRVLHTRAVRGKCFHPELFADPAWDILLALYKAELAQRRISVSSCCVAAQVPTTTGLRHIAALCEHGVLVRTQDKLDRRRMFLSLSAEASAAMQRILRN